MAGFFSNGSCQCQTSLFYLVSDIYELDTNGLGKCLRGRGVTRLSRCVVGGCDMSPLSLKTARHWIMWTQTVTCVLIFEWCLSWRWHFNLVFYRTLHFCAVYVDIIQDTLWKQLHWLFTANTKLHLNASWFSESRKCRTCSLELLLFTCFYFLFRRFSRNPGEDRE